MRKARRLDQWLDTGSFALGVVAEGVAQLRGAGGRRTRVAPAAAPAGGTTAPAGPAPPEGTTDRTPGAGPVRRRAARRSAGPRPAPRRQPRRGGTRPDNSPPRR